MGTEMTVQQTSELAQHFVKSGLFKDINDVSKAVVKVLAGTELGFSPVASMMNIHIISGKLVLGSALIAAKIKNSGKYNYKVKVWTDTGCSLEIYEGDEVIGLSDFSWEDATRANLTSKEVWKSYPRNMLFSRAISNAARIYCPDLFCGMPVYSEGEIEDVPERKPLETKIIQQKERLGERASDGGV